MLIISSLRNVLREMGIPEHFTILYTSQEITNGQNMEKQTSTRVEKGAIQGLHAPLNN